jgi:hypothetical protein
MSEENAMDTQTAKAVLQQEIKDRIEKCTKEVNEVLERHRCVLDASVVVSQRGNQVQIQILPKMEG